MKERTIILCCGKGGCPTLTICEDTNIVKIEDDDGNIVTMDIKQARLISQAVESIAEDDKEE
jgi:hypothetical protein